MFGPRQRQIFGLPTNRLLPKINNIIIGMQGGKEKNQKRSTRLREEL